MQTVTRNSESITFTKSCAGSTSFAFVNGYKIVHFPRRHPAIEWYLVERSDGTFVRGVASLAEALELMAP